MCLMRLAVLLLLSLAACAQSRHIASLYELQDDGSMAFRCTTFPTQHEGSKYTALSAAHCIEDASGPFYIAFDSPTPTFYPAEVGRAREDYVYLTFSSPDTYKLFVLGDSDDIKPGDNTEAIANTYGVGEGLYRGQVVMVNLTRPLLIGGTSADIKRYFVVQMPVYGGASGSPILKDDKVVGIVVAQRNGTLTIALKINVVK